MDDATGFDRTVSCHLPTPRLVTNAGAVCKSMNRRSAAHSPYAANTTDLSILLQTQI